MMREFWRAKSRLDAGATNGNVKGAHLKAAATNSAGTTPARLGDSHSLASWGAASSAPTTENQKPKSRRDAGATYLPPDCFPTAPLLMLLLEGVRPVRAACSWGVRVN